jgi:hypothetical protein
MLRENGFRALPLISHLRSRNNHMAPVFFLG